MRKIFSSKIFLIILALIVIAVGLKVYILTNSSKSLSLQPVTRVEETKSDLINGSDSEAFVEIAGKTVGVELAVTPEERSQGLSGSEPLKKDHGMFFVFEIPATYGFWMKDMNYSIDIIWIDAQKRVVHIEKNLSPDTYPKVFVPGSQALYVLEVPAGFSDENGVKIGDQIKLIANT